MRKERNMPYVDKNTPVIQKIQLPSGSNPYFIADREIRDVVEAISDTIAGGVSYNIGWDGTGEPTVGNIPAGVVVTYNGTEYTGTLDANNAAPGAFYLVKSGDDTLDIYSEYVPVGTTGNKTWQKLGDTQIDLSDIVTDVTLNKQTKSVIGSDSTFTVTQPTVSLATESTSGTGKVQVVTGVSNISASGDEVSAVTELGTPNTKSAIGANSTFTVTQPTVALSSNTSSATGRVQVVTGATASTTNIKATASGTAVNASGDNVTVITGYDNPSTDTFVKTVSTTDKKLATTSITGVNGSTTASKATAANNQTTANGSFTTSTSNTDVLKGISVNNGVLSFGAATLDTQTTTQFTFNDVDVPIAAASATTVATGKTATNDSSGDTVITAASAGSSASAVTALGTASTDSVIGTGSTFTVTQPTVTLATDTTSGTGKVSVATGITPTTTYLGAAASNGNVAWNSKDSVTAVTGYSNVTTDNVLGTGTTITASPTTTYLKATATGANTEWNNKDSATVLTNATSITVDKG